MIEQNNDLAVLFDRAKNKGLLWSYAKDISFDKFNKNILIEIILQYGDWDSLCLLFKVVNRDELYNIWINKVAHDHRFIRTNLLVANVFFEFELSAEQLSNLKNQRFEKLKLLSSQD